MKQINFNRYQFFGKLIIQIVLVCLLILCLYCFVFPRTKDNFFALLCFAIFIVLMNFFIFVQLYYLPIGVIIDQETSSLEVKYLFRKSFIKNSDIDSFAQTSIYTKSSQYDGILITLKSKMKVLFSDFNLNDYKAIADYLKMNEIKNSGEEKFRFVSYYRQKILNGIA
ncbi:hypothetical protein FNO01nite_34240 [Flavobacterium noncentrifugens]|uniref:Uncharacterized protein n=1 Tax=Flavobacterium noncentrifugens TaxID=1128970 RepID=A0A1G8XRF4_9FLAO|nr:hypothetical protein [Flavobacterium noncentrifugens]GEP52752.1 hypothetical protein FNO01nite_34240 [Flavobacterium noncentrifugens]SDJ93139.1 hypothetical protein SAMN04487935_2033 [Flavobacterium noncentrifugens]